MPRNLEVLTVTDFTGGLNLRADAFQLRGTESPDMLNVDLDPRGGFAQRDAIRPLTADALAVVPDNIWLFSKHGEASQVMVQQGDNFAYTTGSSWTYEDPDTSTITGRMRATTFKDSCYIQRNAEAGVVKWTGSVDSVLGVTFNDDITSPSGGDMPRAKCIATWGGYVWVAHTNESSTAFPNRVRFSHPNQPEDWHTDHYIDVDSGLDGDMITAIKPHGDYLFIFKQNSVHAITGFDADSFATHEIARHIGAVSQEAVVATEYGIYFFSWPDGVMLLDSAKLEARWVFERIAPAIAGGDISGVSKGSITLGWLGRRLWVSVPWGGSSSNARVFVLDPTLGDRKSSEGGWTVYDLHLGRLIEWHREELDTEFLAIGSDNPRVFRLHQDLPQDAHNADSLELDGSSGAFVWTADSAGLSVVGDLDERVQLALADYTPASTQTLKAKWETSGNQRSWSLDINTSGNLVFSWSVDGTAVITKTSTAAVGFTNGVKWYVRVVLDVDNEAVGNDVKFYTSPDGATWTQLGSTVTTAGVTSIFNSTARVTIGAQLNAGTAQRAIGSFYRASVHNGILGAAVGSPNFTAQAVGAADFIDAEGNTWTVAGTAALEGPAGEIETFYRTRWFDAGKPAVIKRWKRPEIILDNDESVNLRIDAWHDYNPSTVRRTATLSVEAPEGEALWGEAEWGTDAWSTGSEGRQDITRTTLLGRARGVQLRFTKLDPLAVRWSVNAINFKYIPRRVRN